DDEDRHPRSALIVLAPALMLALAVAAPLPQSAAGVVTQIRVQGNVATSDEEVLRLASVQAGMPVGDDTVAEIAARLRRTGRFERVEVHKRFASIADPTQITLVIIVDEGRVHVEMTGDP